jgi:hypothetical protein
MVRTEAERLLDKLEALKDVRRNFEPLWRDCMWYIAPVIQDWDDEKPDSPYKIPKRITNKPSNYLNTCITGIAGYALSPNIKWFKLSLENEELAAASGVRQWLEKCEGVMRRVFEKCGFYHKSIHWLEQSGIFGQAAMLIEETRGSDSPIRYHVPEVQEIYLDDNEIGETETVFRVYWSGIENVVEHYGRGAMHEDALRLYDDIQEKGGGGEKNIKLIHAVYLRRTGAANEAETAGKKKWASVVIDARNKHIIRESGYDEFPYAVFFWEKRGKAYGLSPTMKAVNDIALFQQTEKTRLTVAEYSANPAKNVHEKQRGKENFQPGGYNYYRNPDEIASQLDVGANYPISLQITEALAQNIKEWYNVDFFLMLRQYQNVQNMTATAVAALQGEQTALLSALVSNLYSGLSRVIQRTFNILAKKRMLPPMPFALRVMGGSLKIDFLGVLAQAQKAAYEYSGIMDVLEVSAQFAQFGKIDPEFSKVINWIKPEVVFKKAIESRGAPSETLRTSEEYNEIMKAIGEREAAAQAREAAALENQAVLQNAQNLNERVKPDSLLGSMTGRGRV